MKKPVRFDCSAEVVELGSDLAARTAQETHDDAHSFDGVTFGVAAMSRNAPHAGERHADGDEILYLISGRANVVMLDEGGDTLEMNAGDGLIVPKGTWHRVDILEPCRIVYVTPGSNNQTRPLKSR